MVCHTFVKQADWQGLVAVVGNCVAREGPTRGTAGGRHYLPVEFLHRGQYRDDGGHVSHRRDSPSPYELRGERDGDDAGVARSALECQTSSIELSLVNR